MRKNATGIISQLTERDHSQEPNRLQHLRSPLHLVCFFFFFKNLLTSFINPLVSICKLANVGFLFNYNVCTKIT